MKPAKEKNVIKQEFIQLREKILGGDACSLKKVEL